MARRRIKDFKKEFAARELEDQITETNLPNAISMEGLRIEIDKINKRLCNNTIDSIKSSDLVSLYAWCHEQLYDTIPDELLTSQWGKARDAGIVFMKDTFKGDMPRAIRYFRWAWDRERNKMKWKIEKGYDIYRLKWWDIFVDRSLFTDFKVMEITSAKKNNKRL
jgi:hypothetical protein